MDAMKRKNVERFRREVLEAIEKFVAQLGR
jgi:hypothetical protein